jgi:hypothetical protein
LDVEAELLAPPRGVSTSTSPACAGYVCRKVDISNSPRFNPVLRIRILDPVPFGPLDPGSGMAEKSGSGSGMNKPDHISESLETILGFKYLCKFFDANPGWKKFGSGDQR